MILEKVRKWIRKDEEKIVVLFELMEKIMWFKMVLGLGRGFEGWGNEFEGIKKDWDVVCINGKDGVI